MGSRHGVMKAAATRHGISMEPMLGPVDLSAVWVPESDVKLNALTGRHTGDVDGEGVSMTGPRLDWVIVGGESHGRPSEARLFRQEWGRAMAEQCAAAGVSFFFKQQGSKYQTDAMTVQNHNKGQDKALWAPWMVQQYPRGMAVDGTKSAL